MQKKVYLFVLTGLIFCLLSCGNNLVTTEDDNPPTSPPPTEETVTAHPRLLLKRGEESKIHSLLQNSPNMKATHQYIIDYSDKMMTTAVLEYVLEGKRLLAVANEALKRIYFLSYSYRMTGDEKYAKRAENEMLAICGFKDWNPTHFLDVAEITMALAIGYDWLYDKLPESTRSKVRESIVNKAFVPAGNSKYAKFYTVTNNWNQVCNAGLVLGALAIYDEEPEKSTAIIDKSVKSVPLAMESYGPDGTYPEGYSYWGYGTGFQVTMLAAMESALGKDYGLSENKSFMQSPYFMLLMTAPSGSCYNFCDSGPRIYLQHAMYWFAAKLNDPSILFHEYKYLLDLKKYTGNANERLLPNVLIFSKNTNLSDISSPKRNYWSGGGIKPLFIYKSGWNNKNEAYLGVVGGAASASHGHMDAGSFVYEKNGVKWSIDLGLQSYGTLESQGVNLWNMNQNSQRWAVFRLGNTGHSTLIINGERHNVNGNPQIINTFQTHDVKGAELDLSPIFLSGVSKVIRRVTLDQNNDLHVSDKIDTKATSAKVMWIMVAPEEAKIVGENQIEITKSEQTMLLTVNSPYPVTMKIWDNKPVNSYDADNPGTVRVGFETTIPANSKAELSVFVGTKH